MLSKNKRTRDTPAANPSSERGKPSAKLSLFVGFSESSPAPSPRSPRSFDDGAVGLGIVAAMDGSGDSLSTRSDPIPIVSATRVASAFKRKPWEEEDEEEMERSESYTCVISHLGNTKKVYFDREDRGGGRGDDGDCVVRNCWANPVVLFQLPSPPLAVVETAACPGDDFLNYCYLCKKCLLGLDIFMYRGEKAFCSTECRYQQILHDDYREKCGPEVLKPLEYSASPCSGPLIFAAGVAAA